MHESNFYDVAIVGGGYSGAMTAVNLMRAGLDSHKKIVMIDPSDSPGRGLAYGTWDDNFLLNVPAGNMSALDGVPQHFVDYCRTIDPAMNEGSFVSRRIYGDYLECTLLDTQQGSGVKVERMTAQATSVRPDAGHERFVIGLADGKTIHAARVVLALGHFAPKPPAALLGLAEKSERYIDNPWHFSALNRVPGDLPLLLIGTGLTAVDVLFRVNGDGKRPVTLLSRKGLLPHGHRTTPKQPATAPFPVALDKADLSVRDCLHYLRRRAAQRVSQGGDWRDAVNELRPHTATLWQRWSVRERQRFLRHVVGYWDIHRHRLAPVADVRLRGILAAGSTEVVAARVMSCEATEAGFDVRLRLRGTGECRTLSVGGIVYCTGPNSDLATVDDRLVSQLLADGLIVADHVRIGLSVNEKYEVIGRQGQAIAHLHYAGPMLKAMFWEAIAVPELRAHTRRVAQALVASFRAD